MEEHEGISFTSDIPDDLVCGICKDAASDPQVTEQCGHLFCQGCIETSLKHSSCCPLCRMEDVRMRVDHRAKRQVDALGVKCAHPGCNWTGVHSDLSVHRNNCAHKVFPCTYGSIGCPKQGTEPELVKHEHSETQQHLHLLLKKVFSLEQKNEQIVAANNAANLTIAQLRNDIRATKEQLRQEEELRRSDKLSHDKQFEKIYSELASLRSNLNSNADTNAYEAEWRADSTQFNVTNNGATAMHCIPGWSTLLCKEAVSRGTHGWRFQVSCPGDFITSTVMVGVTSTTNITNTHLGNVPAAWCFQDNGFRWDGKQCFAYGEQCMNGDIIGVHIDFNTGILQFSRNGHLFGDAFSNVGGLLYPAVSLCTEGYSITILR
eukprot:TRINITY_DN37448_c0_g1_i1.p1 TRINITY_DN37448_c0_g1~~TRINITY_DN37448_c0_g1_i1.p1  ORF type:complete len:376 (+),score=37.17 TRINITY_DN37448_c0_g1_i1:60-1187(+)